MTKTTELTRLKTKRQKLSRREKKALNHLRRAAARSAAPKRGDMR